MYPNGELAALRRRREFLVQRSSSLRAASVRTARQIGQSLSWIESAQSLWRKYSGLAKYGAVPALFFARKLLFPRFRFLGPLFRWGPVAFSVLRGFQSSRR